jgi:primosomal protein N' (replication factor Y)
VPPVRVADVALDPRSGGSDSVFTYRADAHAKVGQARFVTVGKRTVLGFITKLYDADEPELGFELRPLGESIENLSLPERVVDLAEFVSEEYLCPLSVALTAATPPGILDRIVSAWHLSTPEQSEVDLFGGSTPTGLKLSDSQREAIRTLQDSGGLIEESPSKRLPAPALKVLRSLLEKGIVKTSVRIAPFQERRRTKDYLTLSGDAEAVENFLRTQGKKKPAQALTLMRLQGAEHASLSIGEIKALAGVTETTVRSLVEEGLLLPSDPDEQIRTTAPTANRYQKLAIDAVEDSLLRRETKAFLLFGVTGSGKTEVYLRLVAEAVRQGRQALYLVPEIALATQSVALLRERFGRGVAILHSELTPSERLQNWMRIRDGSASVVLGARSALFAPLDNLGIIVVDEEHEGSYKQESAPRYDARRVARHLSEIHSCPVVFGSATPSIESFLAAEKEEITLLSLPERAANAILPSVHIEDLSEGYRRGAPTILSDLLHDKIEATLERNEQVILFLNRRAYAPFIICRDCGHQVVCPRCSVTLSFHRRDRKLKCHHCDFQTVPPAICPECQGVRLNPLGIGTEKVEESVQEAFPNAVLARLDRDVAQKKGALESVLANFRSGDTNILIGTQMVAKGLDFPNVTLVGVIAADLSLNIPDFRASERTFQLLSQVAGRSGRGSRPGEVVIQTFNPDHVSVQTAKTHDYPGFFEALRGERREAGYPPFCRLMNIIVSGESRPLVVEAAHELLARTQSCLQSEQSEILGPADCPLERLHNRWRRHLLIKLAAPDTPLWIGNAIADLKPKGVQIVVDVDPQSLM